MDENSSIPPGWPPSPGHVPVPPPTSVPPPIIMPPAPPPKSRGGRGWMVLALVLLVLLGFSALMNMSQLAQAFLPTSAVRYTHTIGPKLEEMLIEDRDTSLKVAVVEVDGIITGQMSDQAGFSMVDVIRAQFKRAAEDSKIRAVILKVNSPGGEVLASDEISRIISEFQRTSRKPVVASMGDLAASGGYYISAPCRWIVANELTLTGSIGVILSSWNYRGLMDKVGVRPRVYKSGKFKDMLSPSRDPNSVTPEEDQMLHDLVAQTYSKFKSVVAEGREKAHNLNNTDGQELNSDWADYADGRILSGKDAYKLGFVDELGTFEDAFKTARRLAGISTADLIKYQQRIDLSDLLRFFGKADSQKTVKVDLGLDPPKLRVGQLYFLAPSLVH